jgi:hypothetical protein
VGNVGLPSIAVTRVADTQAHVPDADADSDHDRGGHRGHCPMTTESKDRDMKKTATNLIRWAGLSAAAGMLFVFVQSIHPPELLASVTTGRWIVVHCLSVAMGFFWLLGLTGLYARQVEEVGWLGLAGFLLLSLFLVLTAAFTFAEAFNLPPLATAAPAFVEGFLGISSGAAGETDLGALPALYTLSGVLYLLGGVLFGTATLRAGILPRWAAGVLAVGTVLPLAFSLLPQVPVRLAAVPVGVALAWLGLALWSERRVRASEPVPGRPGPQPRQTGAV